MDNILNGVPTSVPTSVPTGGSKRARRIVRMALGQNPQQPQNAQPVENAPHLNQNPEVVGQLRPGDAVGPNGRRMLRALQAQVQQQAQGPGQVPDENNHPNLQAGEQPVGQIDGCADFDDDLAEGQYDTAVSSHGSDNTSSDNDSNDTEELKAFRKAFEEKYNSSRRARCQSPADDAPSGSLNDSSAEVNGAAAGELQTNSNGGNGQGTPDGYKTPTDAVIPEPRRRVSAAGNPPAAVFPQRPFVSNGAAAGPSINSNGGNGQGTPDGYTTPTDEAATIKNPRSVSAAGIPQAPRRETRVSERVVSNGAAAGPSINSNGGNGAGGNGLVTSDGYTTPTNAVISDRDILSAGPPPLHRGEGRIPRSLNLGVNASGFLQLSQFPVVQSPVHDVKPEGNSVNVKHEVNAEDVNVKSEVKVEVKVEVEDEFKASDLSAGCKPGSSLGQRKGGPDDDNSNGGPSIGGPSSAFVRVVKQKGI